MQKDGTLTDKNKISGMFNAADFDKQ